MFNRDITFDVDAEEILRIVKQDIPLLQKTITKMIEKCL